MNKPLVTIVCATYLEENDRYLRTALKSIENQTYKNIEFILVSSGEYEPKDLPDWVRHIHHSKRHHYPEAINSGFKYASKDSKYYFMINDDVIITKDAIENMVGVIGESEIVLNPISNCDNGFKYHLVMGFFKNGDFIPMKQRFYRYDDLKDNHLDLMDTHSLYPWGIVAQDFVCFYATMMPKTVWDKVGGLDNEYQTGQDDVDFSLRAKKIGIPCGIALNALIWHYGGATADIALTQENRAFNIDYFKKKWGQNPP